VGEWSVIVKDTVVNEHSGQFVDWRLNLWGEAIDGTDQPLHPLPNDHDDDHPYEEAHVATTTVQAVPTKTSTPTHPDDQHDRPVNQKPPQASETFPAGELDTSKPADATSPTASPTSTSSAISNYLPSFGASKRTQIWIYASLAMIIVFFIGLGVYFQLQRQKRRRTNAQDDYEFEMVEDEDETHPMTGGAGRTQRRGGELYNAFAGESDEEVFSEDDDEPYRDRLANISEKDDEGEDDSPGSHLLSEKR
jgi:kexin